MQRRSFTHTFRTLCPSELLLSQDELRFGSSDQFVSLLCVQKTQHHQQNSCLISEIFLLPPGRIRSILPSATTAVMYVSFEGSPT